MSFSEINNSSFETGKGENNSFDVDKRAEVSETQEAEENEKFDIDKRAKVENDIEKSKDTEEYDIDKPIDVSQQQEADNGDVAKTKNNDNSESDKTEDVLKNQYDSNENKQADVDKDNRSIDKTDNIEKSENESIKNCPIENGSWKGERGNSKWTPDGEYTPKKHNPEGKIWNKILEEYEIDGIEFIEGEPDFKDISKGDVEIDGFSESRSDNYDKADIELAKQKGCSPEDVAKWRAENKYTWHECKDMKTMQKVPSIVHGNVSHRGGVSVAKGG